MNQYIDIIIQNDHLQEEEVQAGDLFALEQPKVAKQPTAVEYVQEDDYEASTSNISTEKKITKDITHWWRWRKLSSSSSPANRQRWKSSQLLCKMGWKMMVLLLSNVYQTQSLRKIIDTYILNRWSKRIIWNYLISSNRWRLWNRNIEVKGRDLWRVSLMRKDPTQLRTVKIAIISLSLTCSCLGSLRSIRGSFRPIFQLKKCKEHVEIIHTSQVVTNSFKKYIR